MADRLKPGETGVEKFEYSVVIRTTGQAGQKYARLLESIDRLSPGPEEVIVALPEGADLPAERLGYERYVFSPRGMVVQRLAGLKTCRTPYALFCDDDVSFGPDFAAKLYRPVGEGKAFFAAGPLYSFLPRVGLNAVFCVLTAQASPTLFHRETRYVTVLRSTGYSYNRHLRTDPGRIYETQSVAWTCFFADVGAFRSLVLEEETWLDAHGYSAMDDQTMFYKAWLQGKKSVVVPDALYEHLDAKTSSRKNKPAVLYATTFNRFIFWHRFILLQEKNWGGRTLAKAAFGYRSFCDRIWDLLSVARKKITREDYALRRKGERDARAYVESEQYRKLPPVQSTGQYR